MTLFQALQKSKSSDLPTNKQNDSKFVKNYKNDLSYKMDLINPPTFSRKPIFGSSINQRFNQSIIRFNFANIQTKLKVSKPGDIYEQEADRVAEKVMCMSSSSNYLLLANTSTIGNEKSEYKCDSSTRKDEQEKMEISTKKRSVNTSSNFQASEKVADDIHTIVSREGGSPLDTSSKEFMESRFGYNFGNVKIHNDERAARSAKDVNALAYTLGNDIIFGEGQYVPNTLKGRRLLAHELTHVIQQNHSKISQSFLKTTIPSLTRNFSSNLALPLVQRYETGEHVAFGGDKAKQEIIVINGVQMTYGEMIAMGDFFERADDIYDEEPKKLERLVNLIRKEVTGGTVSQKDWNDATSGRYLKLAEQNISHFAPHNPKLVRQRSTSEINHKTEWERYHEAALSYASKGMKNEALVLNAFGDHFLTDAFAAGHIINKLDVMENFKIALESSKKQKEDFFDNVAKVVFADKAVRDLVSKYETVEFKGVVFRPNIDSAGRFSKLLQGIYDAEPTIVWSAIAKAIHDKLNKLPAGLKVENAKGDTWELSGDGTLNTKTLEIGIKAVAQSRQNILNAFINYVAPIKTPGPLVPSLPLLFKSVWDYVPYPSEEGTKRIVNTVELFTNPRQGTTTNYVGNLIKQNIPLIIDELVKRNIIKKA